jgi:succinyldiaminopimelate transaminase
MINPRLAALNDYPFDRLRALLEGVTPPADLSPMVLSVGEPRHPPPAMVAEVLARNADGWGRYPPVEGTSGFRRAVAGWLARRYGLKDGVIDPDRHIIPVSGTREALFMAAALAVPKSRNGHRPKVIMPNPFYHTYFGAAAMWGAEPVPLPATRATRFLPDLDALDATTLDATALFYLCSPSNPQGAVADTAYLRRAIGLARAHDFVLAADECYTEIYDRAPPPGALQVCGDLDLGGDPGGDLAGNFSNVLVFHSLSKRSSVPGLRSGFVAGDERLIAALRRLRTFGGATVPLPVLEAAQALWDDDEHVWANQTLYRQKFDLAEALLGDRFGFYRPEGAFFLWLEVGDEEQAARTLWREAAIRVLPGSYLGLPDASGVNPGGGFIRIALIDDVAATQQALQRLARVL